MRELAICMQRKETRRPTVRMGVLLGGLYVAMSSLSGCQRAESLTVEREIFVPALGRPNFIARTAQGNLVVGAGTAREVVFAIQPDGKLLWRMDAPRDTSIPARQDQPEFQNAVALPNGNLLLCGEKPATGQGGAGGLILILDPGGTVLDRRVVYPKGDRTFSRAGFTRCIRWEDRILVSGAANSGTQWISWHMTLDGNGAEVSELLSPDIHGTAIEMADHDLVFATSVLETSDTLIFRLNQKFEIVAKRTIATDGYWALLRPVTPGDSVEAIANDVKGKSTLYTLNEKLQDKESPRPVGSAHIGQYGCGYVLSDGSLALFGQTGGPGGEIIAAVAHIGPNGSSSVRAFGSASRGGPLSFSFFDAVPLSASRFVAVRDQASADPNATGIVLSWIRFDR
jgi:hypothetical protein